MPNIEYETLEHFEVPVGDEKYYVERFRWTNKDSETTGIKCSVQRVYEREDQSPIRKKNLPIEDDPEVIKALADALIKLSKKAGK